VSRLDFERVLTLRKEELSWFNQKGADMIFPDYFERYKQVMPEEDRHDMIKALYKTLHGNDV
jgi:proline iminopeptidase